MNRKPTLSHSDSLELTSLLGALSLFLSTVEFVIPNPLPVKLGLANLPVILSIVLIKPYYVMILVFIKITGQAIINGTLFSYIFLFSAAGSISSAAVMTGVYYLFRKWISLVGVSLLGSLASNLSQIYMAALFVFGESSWMIAPAILLTGLITSIILGGFAELFLSKSKWVRKYYLKEGGGGAASETQSGS